MRSFQTTSSIQAYANKFHLSTIQYQRYGLFNVWWLQLACPTMKWLWNICKEWDNFATSYISTGAGFRPSAVVISSRDTILIVAAFKCEWMGLYEYFPIGDMIDIKRLWNNIYCSFALLHTAIPKRNTISKNSHPTTGSWRSLCWQKQSSNSRLQYVLISDVFNRGIHISSLKFFNSHMVQRWSKYPILTRLIIQTQLLMTDFQPVPVKRLPPCNSWWEHLLKRTCAENVAHAVGWYAFSFLLSGHCALTPGCKA